MTYAGLMSWNAGQIVAMVMATKQVIPSLLAALGNQRSGYHRLIKKEDS